MKKPRKLPLPPSQRPWGVHRGHERYLVKVMKAAGGLTPGTLSVAELWHEPECRRPAGGPCTCPDGPEVRIAPALDPKRN